MQSITLKEVISLKQYAELIIQIIKYTESLQEDNSVSDYHKDRAKINAYDEIAALVKLGGE